MGEEGEEGEVLGEGGDGVADGGDVAALGAGEGGGRGGGGEDSDEAVFAEAVAALEDERGFLVLVVVAVADPAA